MPNSSAKKKAITPVKFPHEKDDSSESELQIDTNGFETPTKKSENIKETRSVPNSSRKKKRRRIRKSSTGEDEKIDLAIEDIEDTIQSCIQKNKELTPEAIKIILRKLVKNEHVLAICRLKEEEMAQKSEENGNDADDENDEVIPKLTRAKAKQMDKKLLPLVPLKQPEKDSEVVEFLQKEIHDDDETDPEYQPEEDANTTISDIDSLPATPQSTKKPETEEILFDGLFKLPRMRNESLTQSEGEAEPICKRTRTRLCLETTPIETLESTLVAPDITMDMYDHDMDVDKHWADFLNEFARPLNPNADDDDPNDPEFKPVDAVPLDKEELANVAISKKEYNTLLKELMEIVDTMDDSLLETSVVQTPTNTKETEKKLRSPRSVRKRASSNVNETPLSTRKQQEELHTPPLETSTPFVPNLMSTTINSISSAELSSIPVQPVFHEIQEKNAIIETKPLINMSIQNPVNPEQFIALDGLNLLSYAQYQDGVYYLPTTQKILIEVPTEHLLRSISPQSNNKIILSDSLNSQTSNMMTTFNISNSSIVYIDGSNLKLGKTKPIKTYENIDFSPPPPVLEKRDLSLGMTDEQRKILEQQLRMHVQITTQNYLQTYSHPKYWQQADQFVGYLYEIEPLTRWSEQYPVVQMAIDLMQQWKRNVDGVSGKFIVDWFYKEWEKETDSKQCSGKWIKPSLCPKIMETMISSPVFAFPKLLPKIAFKSDYFTEKNKTEFLSGEEILIALGLETLAKKRQEEVDRMNKTAGKIKFKVTLRYLSEKLSENLVKCRNKTAIHARIRFCRDSSNMNPIKYWFDYGVAPNFIYRFESMDLSTTIKDKIEDLDTKWKDFVMDILMETEKRKSTVTKELLRSNHDRTVARVSRKEEKSRPKSNKSSPDTSRDVILEFQANHVESASVSKEKFVNKSESVSKRDDEEDLPLELRLKRLKQTSGEVKKSKRGPKPSAKTYKHTLKSIIPVFIKNLNQANRKYDKACVERGVKLSKVLWNVYQKVKALDIFSSFLNELKSMAASPQNLKKMVKPPPSTDKKKVLPEQDTIYAQNFFEKVEETLLTANKFEEFEKFANILKTFDPSKERVADLYYKMEKIFHPNHPELLSLFLTFLEPGQAMQVGKFFEHFIMTNMSTFLEKLNKYFVKQPAQIKKIYNCLNELSSMEDVTIEMVKESILPLLKGNPLLIDWFQQMFSNEKPIDYNEGDSETINWKKTTTSENQDQEVYEELVLSETPSNSETPACGVRYFQGNIMYSGRTCTLPAKISFLAYETVMQQEKREQAMKKSQGSSSENMKQGGSCCHAIKSYADSRLLEKIKSVGNEKDTNSSHSSDEVEQNLATENVKVKKETGGTPTENYEAYYSTDDEQPKLADTNTLKVHAIRLNPAVHARNGENFADMSHLLTSPQNVIEKYFSDDTKSPTKKSSTPSTSSHINTKTSKKLLMSPKTVSKIIKSPPQSRKSQSDAIPDNSQALNTGKRLKTLVESDHSDIDSPTTNATIHAKRNKKLKSVKSQEKKSEEENESQKIKEQPEKPKLAEPTVEPQQIPVEETKNVTIDPIVEPKPIKPQPWTREEDKFILEEQRKGYESVPELVARLKEKLTNRTTAEVNERFEFLIEMLRKIQQKS